MKAIRLKQMEQYIIEREFVSIKELCEKFGIHSNTVRADIKELEEKGVVHKRYGGVAYTTSNNPPISVVERQERNAPSKTAIGQLAAGLLRNDDVIFVDSGTTVPRLFHNPAALPKQLTIVTNNLDVISWASLNTEYTVFSLPGILNRKLGAFASLETIDSIRSYNIQKAFIGANGISLGGELSSTSNIDAKLKATAISLSETVVLMADCNKVGQAAMFKFASLQNVHYWACDNWTDPVLTLADLHDVTLLEK